MPEKAPLLVVDDDVELCELLSDLLGEEGFEVSSVHDGATGLSRAASGKYAVVILDVMLPKLTGFEVLTRLRKESDVPVLMLTARGEDVNRIVGLEMGADDYLPKPFNPRELVARVRALYRRSSLAKGAPVQTETLVSGDITVALSARRAQVGERDVSLTTAEFDLLEALVRQAGKVVSREDLTRIVLGRRLAVMDRAIDMHVSNLRKKLGPFPSGGDRIKTIRSTGYILAVEGS